MRGRWFGPVLLGLVAVALLPAPARVYPERPPPAHTGGFGEPTCRRCHFDQELDAPGGALTLGGVPEAYAPGARYRLRVALARPAMQRGGFQLAARFAEGEQAGRQAGTLRPVDDRVEVVLDDSSAVAYAHHTGAGTLLEAPEAARWTVEWTAPEAASGRVVFHVAANAANDDDSELGDYIYAQAGFSRARAGRKK